MKNDPATSGGTELNGDIILQTLERASEVGDPCAGTYDRVFRKHPALEKLFVRDRDGAVRGHMFQEVVAALIDFVGPNAYGGNLFRIEHTNHEQLGVPPDIYPLMFQALRDELKGLLGTTWSAEDERAWAELLARIEGLLDAQENPA